MKGSSVTFAATSFCCPTASTTLLNLGYESDALLSLYPKAYARSVVSTLTPYLFQASASTVSSSAMDNQRSAAGPKDIITIVSQQDMDSSFTLQRSQFISHVCPPWVLQRPAARKQQRTQARSRSSCFYPAGSFSHGAAQPRTGLARTVILLNMHHHAQTISIVVFCSHSSCSHRRSKHKTNCISP